MTSDPAAQPFAGAYRGARVLITGHTGFKGSWLCSWLLRLGAQVCGYACDIPTQPSLFALSGLAARVDHQVGDVRDLPTLRRVLHGFRPEFVFHLAAQSLVRASYADAAGTVATNVIGTTHLLEALRDIDWHCAAVIVTSDKCYDTDDRGRPHREGDRLGGADVYSASKAAAEIILSGYRQAFFSRKDGPVKLASARAGNVIGGGDWAADRIVPDCMRAWGAGGRVQVRMPQSVRPWQHVLESLSGYLALAQQLGQGGAGRDTAYNFGPSGSPDHTVAALLGDLAAAWGFARAQDAWEAPPDTGFAEVATLRLDSAKAQAELGWVPTLCYAETIAMTGSWYRAVLREGADAAEATLAQIAAYERLAAARGRSWAPP
jgi:CDP-glucose 4,6-dehydratase